MSYSVPQRTFLCVARTIQSSTVVPLRASADYHQRRHAGNTLCHRSPPSRRLYHEYPAASSAPAHDSSPRDQPAAELRPPPPVSTANKDEVAHFSRLSALWWDEDGEFALLHKMNAHRMRFIREKVLEVRRDEQEDFGETVTTTPSSLHRVLEGMNVLDVGCGGGILSESLTRLGANTLAVDASAENIHIATYHAAADPRLASLSYRHALAETLVQEPKRFDVVCSMEVIEHVDNPAEFLRSCAELVKPGGHLFLSTVARTPLSYLLTIVAAEKLFRLVEPGTHTFSKFINPDELVGFFAKPLAPDARPWISHTYAHGLPTRVEAEVRGIVYLPWRGDWALAPRATTPWSTQSSYLFWVRKPKDNL